ncbi:unnamed protein product, partial [Discosporangium mesarthrocarpum]
ERRKERTHRGVVAALSDPPWERIMLVDTPQITWHGGEAGKNDPVLSLDIHPLMLPRKGTTDVGVDSTINLGFLLATAGTDGEVRLWIVDRPSKDEERDWEKPEISRGLHRFVASLGGHQRGVNVVRFSPNGLSLASASDGGTIVIWCVEEIQAWAKLESDRETKKVILRGAQEDVYDLTWSPDSRFIACGSIDRRAHVWEVAAKRSVVTLEDHTNYVQGTAWDPLCKYIATQSSDRSCRVYQLGAAYSRGGAAGGGGSAPLTVNKGNTIIKFAAANTTTEYPTAAVRAGVGSGVGTEAGKGAGEVMPKPEAIGVGDTATTPTPGQSICPPGQSICPPGQSIHVPGRGDGSLDGGEGDSSTDRGGGGGVGGGGGGGGSKTPPRGKLFGDETVGSFFRRLAWTPDGAFLVTPTGQFQDPRTGNTAFCTYLFSRENFAR